MLSIVISPPALKVHCGHQNMNQGVLRTTTEKARFLEGEEETREECLFAIFNFPIDMTVTLVINPLIPKKA